MGPLYIATEGLVDQVILAGALAPEVQRGEVRVKGAGSQYAAISLAASVRIEGRQPVALVVDADTLDEDNVRTQELTLDSLLRLAGAGVPAKVFLARPSVEALLFERDDVAEQLFRHPLTEVQRAVAHYDPKRVIAELMGGQTDGLPELLAHSDLRPLRSTALIAELLNFKASAEARAA